MLLVSLGTAADNMIKFQTGPFSGSVDLGIACNDTKINNPTSDEDLSGDWYEDCSITICGVLFEFMKFTNRLFDTTAPFSTAGIRNDLISSNVEKDTIELYQRKINGMPGAAGAAYLPQGAGLICAARYYVSQDSIGFVYCQNRSQMALILKSLKVTEDA
jgi:hypothetical protein